METVMYQITLQNGKGNLFYINWSFPEIRSSEQADELIEEINTELGKTNLVKTYGHFSVYTTGEIKRL